MTGLALSLAQDLAYRLRGHWRRSLIEPLWGRSAIIVLQRVLPSEAEARLPHRAPWCLGPESFERLLLTLSELSRLVCLDTALKPHHDPQARISLTFDGGWRDNLEIAAPLLEHYALPASIFVNTSWLHRPHGAWRETIGEGLWQRQHPTRIRDALGDAGLPLPPMPPKHPDTAYSRALLGYLLQLARHDSRTLEATGDTLHGDLGQPRQGLDPFSIRRLENGGLVRFGARGVDMRALDVQDDAAIRWQVRHSRQELARLCREPLAAFAYPESQPSLRVQQLANRCGVSLALAGQGGWLGRHDNPLALPRIAVNQRLAESPGRLFDHLLGQL
ncbi:polysaccharide deacetylase family protein [Halomonas sp. HP20-15]|uniref:polysaccharide deacetylase family protein n=1 Tax=Halomonas sp. HP20-15 TaxID=3085901 RepID=UPI0029811117|nr:polysaccharide deacetylase family protein [Halomonas sp. HP20-15]MDW5378584.1 polysaccharide deacetylase family protein [Halomonas sp. HP20-15]